MNLSFIASVSFMVSQLTNNNFLDKQIPLTVNEGKFGNLKSLRAINLSPFWTATTGMTATRGYVPPPSLTPTYAQLHLFSTAFRPVFKQ